MSIPLQRDQWMDAVEERLRPHHEIFRHVFMDGANDVAAEDAALRALHTIASMANFINYFTRLEQAIDDAIQQGRFALLIRMFDTMDATGRMGDNGRTWLQELLWRNPQIFESAAPHPEIIGALVQRSSEFAVRRSMYYEQDATLIGGLIAAKASVVTRNDAGYQGLVWQAIDDGGDLALVQVLLQAKATIGDQCLSLSINTEKYNVADMLLENGCTVNEQAIEASLNANGNDDMLHRLLETARAHDAAEYMRLIHYGIIHVGDSVPHVQHLLNTKVDLANVVVPQNSPDGFLGQHSLLGHKLDDQSPRSPNTLTVIQLLLDANANPRPIEEDVIVSAVQTDNPEVFNLLIAAKARVNPVICQTALRRAAELQHTDAARWLVREGCVGNLGQHQYNQAVRTAIQYWGAPGTRASAYFPIPTEANANARMEYLVTALRRASEEDEDNRGIHRMIGSMVPFQRRPHVRSGAHGDVDIREEVWAAVAPNENEHALTDSRDVTAAIVALGIDVTLNAVQNEIDRIQRLAGPFNGIRGDYFFILMEHATRMRPSDLVWPANPLPDGEEDDEEDDEEDEDDTDIGRLRRRRRVISGMRFSVFKRARGEPSTGA